MIREFAASDDIVGLTVLLHHAYAPLAAQGLRFSATHQMPEVTAQRIARGRCFVLESCGVIIGTIAVYHPDPASPIPTYREPATFQFGQFAIAPEHKGKGLGKRLHAHVVAHSRALGGKTLALDTASTATDLIAMYLRWEYREVARHRWHDTNYESVILARSL